MSRLKEIGYGLAGLVLLAVIYFGSYFAMLTPAMWWDEFGLAKPKYRLGGDAVDAFYFPAFNLDRMLRPKQWRSRSEVIFDIN